MQGCRRQLQGLEEQARRSGGQQVGLVEEAEKMGTAALWVGEWQGRWRGGEVGRDRAGVAGHCVCNAEALEARGDAGSGRVGRGFLPHSPQQGAVSLCTYVHWPPAKALSHTSTQSDDNSVPNSGHFPTFPRGKRRSSEGQRLGQGRGSQTPASWACGRGCAARRPQSGAVAPADPAADWPGPGRGAGPQPRAADGRAGAGDCCSPEDRGGGCTASAASPRLPRRGPRGPGRAPSAVSRGPRPSSPRRA